MAQYGLGNFVYELDIKDGNANFKFIDPDDASNTADVSVSKKDFDGFSADSRQVADLAYSQCSKLLNEARDKRLQKEAADLDAANKAEDQRARDAAKEFFDNAQDVQVAPAKVEKDGTTVYNTAEAADETDASDDKSSKK
jgi:hypothetical protein